MTTAYARPAQTSDTLLPYVYCPVSLALEPVPSVWQLRGFPAGHCRTPEAPTGHAVAVAAWPVDAVFDALGREIARFFCAATSQRGCGAFTDAATKIEEAVSALDWVISSLGPFEHLELAAAELKDHQRLLREGIPGWHGRRSARDDLQAVLGGFLYTTELLRRQVVETNARWDRSREQGERFRSTAFWERLIEPFLDITNPGVRSTFSDAAIEQRLRRLTERHKGRYRAVGAGFLRMALRNPIKIVPVP